ncbi:MAG: hypothetical protein Q9M50_07850 [Methylococcales bacterium]|nr:hypothetical protein [Methylococcales bacterium]
MFLSINKQKMKFFLLFSVIAAFILSFSLRSTQIEEQFINLAVEENLHYLPDAVKNESVEIKAILLDYADNKELVLESWVSLKKYPNKAENIFLLYGEEKEFQNALIMYGDHVIPVTDYFLKNEDFLWKIKESFKNSLSNTWNWITSNKQKTSVTLLSPEKRAWYAINYINEEGHGFLSEFPIDKHGDAKWMQTTRFLRGFGLFMTSGIRDLETKYKTKQEITGGDIFWASFDVIALTSGFKLLKSSKALSVSKAVRSGKKLSMFRKARVFTSKFLKTKTAQKMVKYGAFATTAYIAIAHPSLISHLFEEIGYFLGINSWVVKLFSWTTIIFILLYPFTWGFKYFIRPLIWLMKTFISWGIKIEAFIYKNNFQLKSTKKRR